MSKITLKSFKTIESMSEETICFSAKVYLDKVLIGEAMNEGHGGSTDFTPSKGYSPAIKQELPLDKLIDAIDNEVYKIIGDKEASKTLKSLKRQMAKRVLFLKGEDNSNNYSYFEASNKTILSEQEVVYLSMRITQKYPNAIILNGLSDEKILELIKL